MIRLGINGLGRIGRCILRLSLINKNIKVEHINDINPDINNIAYLIKYDSTFGPLNKTVIIKNNTLEINGSKITYSNFKDISKVNWHKKKINIIVDSSGNKKNIINSKKLKKYVDHIVFTNHVEKKFINRTLIFGVNENEFEKNDFLLSSSICDATAIAPVLKTIDLNFGISTGFLTTLHPWLSYQNLLDGPSRSYTIPGQIIDNYALGRASINSVIPKNTSAMKATFEVLPSIKGKFLTNSYRIPTSIVSSADITLKLNKNINYEKIYKVLKKVNKKILKLNREPLISIDFVRNSNSSVLDLRFLKIMNNYLKFIIWYDNEWGYSSRVIDLINFIDKKSS